MRRFIEALDALAAERAGCATAADELGRDVDDDLIDQPLGEERGVDLTAALDQNTEDVAAAELVPEGLEVDAALICGGQLEDLGEANLAFFGGGDQGVGADDSGRLADPELAVEDDPERLARVLAVDPRVELGIVLQHCVDTDQDRVVLVAKAVRVKSGLFARYPAGLPRARGDLAVQAHRELGSHERAACEAMLDVELVEASGPFL